MTSQLSPAPMLRPNTIWGSVSLLPPLESGLSPIFRLTIAMLKQPERATPSLRTLRVEERLQPGREDMAMEVASPWPVVLAETT